MFVPCVCEKKIGDIHCCKLRIEDLSSLKTNNNPEQNSSWKSDFLFLNGVRLLFSWVLAVFLGGDQNCQLVLAKKAKGAGVILNPSTKRVAFFSHH